MIPYNKNIQEKAITLRNKGKSYSQIAKALKIGKSTVGFWFKNVPAISKKVKKVLKPKKKSKK
jgi:transposase-like protein